MKQETKNKILIVLAYFISLILFELVIGIGTFDQSARESAKLGYDNPFVLFAPFAEAGFYHFIFVSLVAIYVRVSKKIAKDYKHVIYWFPLLTFYLTLPMSIPTAIIARILHIPFGNV